MKKDVRFLFPLPFLIASSFAWSNITSYPPQQASPIEAKNTPMFISLGFDDNIEADGLRWISKALSSHTNPQGLDSFAGSPLMSSFFLHCQPARQQPEIIDLWRKLNTDGHDIASHTETHPDDKINYNPFESWMTAEQWQQEVALCNEFLTQPVEQGGVGAPAVAGFRAPFLTFNDNTLDALTTNAIQYDVSFPAGITTEENGTNNYWPHTLDQGSPSQSVAQQGGWKPAVKNMPGLWEVPLQALIVPTDEEAAEYGLTYSLNDKIASRVPYYDPSARKADNFDWNLYTTPAWGGYGLNAADVLTLYKYNLDLHLSGNRAPLVLGLHSAFYGKINGEEHFGMPETSVADRQAVLKQFIEYALSKQQVRFVSHRQLVEWMQNPSPVLTCEQAIWSAHTTYRSGDIVQFNGKYWKAKWWTVQEIPGNTADGPWQAQTGCNG
ncbi:polysaccharide deacetylase family protein [Photobacterium sp. WH77]|uniref:carbohydrate-binding protein n=1 Tax=unclassified Photobacterium TaxID=2628852 RepID=UPI001ED9EB26|nr:MULTISPECIES: carbohydrate-binding protein [unclassified Photobacterium]MCG2837441.1 polysaccharide deacetylase family protein [Photobacterium sp. WH77]MCG2844989.1 polysaccharide deacetylase family protein [Photobacterium sp. WH80]